MLLVKLIEPPCTEPYARWCERSGDYPNLPPTRSYAIIEVGKVAKMQVKEVGKVTLLNCSKREMGEAEKSDDSNAIFEHKSFGERLKEYGGAIEVYEFDWGEPVGREMM